MFDWVTNLTPTGDYSDLRGNIKLDPNASLFDRVLAPENLKKAWQRVRANKGVAGVDGVTIEHFLDWSQQHWKQVVTDLEGENYRPQPVKRVEIDKPDGGKRLLGIPTVLDRVIQQAIVQRTVKRTPRFSSKEQMVNRTVMQRNKNKPNKSHATIMIYGDC